MSTDTMIAIAAALVIGAGTAAVAMINYEANAPLAAFAPQNDPAAVAIQHPVASCDTTKHPFFKDNGRFITDTSLPSLKQQSRC
jgi:hypothetical protein